MKVTFEGTLEGILIEIEDFLNFTQEETDIDTPTKVELSEPKTSSRRKPSTTSTSEAPVALDEAEVSDAEHDVEEAKAEAAAEPAPPKASRRKPSGSKTEAKAEPKAEKPKRGKKTDGDKEIASLEVAKACSEAGRIITPVSVRDIITKLFGEDMKVLEELDQGQRRKLIDTLSVEVEKAA